MVILTKGFTCVSNGTRETCMCKSGVQERERRQLMIILCYSKCCKGMVQEVCPRAMELAQHCLTCVRGEGDGDHVIGRTPVKAEHI